MSRSVKGVLSLYRPLLLFFLNSWRGQIHLKYLEIGVVTGFGTPTHVTKPCHVFSRGVCLKPQVFERFFIIRFHLPEGYFVVLRSCVHLRKYFQTPPARTHKTLPRKTNAANS